MNSDNSYNSEEDCKNNIKVVNNDKYKFLDEQKLSHDIVADKEQLLNKLLIPRAKHNLKHYSININNKFLSNPSFNNYFSDMNSINIYNIKNQFTSFINTLNYLFYDMFMAIYVRIRNNKLDMYVPFYNIDYKNNWGNQLKFKNYKGLANNVNDFIKTKSFELRYKNKVLYNPSKWNANNCLIGNAYPIYMSDTRLSEFKLLLETVCKERKISDTEFFINKRDFPILKKDQRHPYHHLFNSTPPKYNYDSYIPILSVSTNSDYADYLIPTEDDIDLLLQKFVPNRCKNDYHNIKDTYNWNEKINKAVFRGKLTGCGITIETNQRLKLVSIAEKHKDIIDAGITSWNIREKAFNGIVQYVNPKDFPFNKKPFMSRQEQYKHKYLINVDGHVSAFRLLSELMTNSLVIKVNSSNNYELWYSKLLIPFVHYVPVKEDMSDLIEQIQWCINNDDKCKEIINNAHKLVKEYLTKDGMLDYMEALLNSIPCQQEQNGDIEKINTMSVGNNWNKIKQEYYLLKKKELPKFCIKPITDNLLVSGKPVIIIPYRDNLKQDRKSQLNKFLQHFKDKSPYIPILVIEQSQDNKKFNRGALLNIGYELSKNNYDTFIFHDVDLLPDDDLLKYYNKKPLLPLHLGFQQTKYNYFHLMGGVLSISKEDFIKTNGFPNNFWGWGGEDDDFKFRLIKNNICIIRPDKGNYIELKHIDTKQIKEFVFETPVERILEDFTNDKWRNNGLSNLAYRILERKNLNKENHNLVLVEIL